MIKIVFAILLISTVSFAQEKKQDAADGRMLGQTIRNTNIKDNKVKGSRYLQKMFAVAKVENITRKSIMRYNVFDDEFEFISPTSDTLILDKNPDFSPIVFSGTNKRYILTQYTNNGKLFFGYLIHLYDKASFALLKKENLMFYEEKPAKTTLEVTQPARFTKTNDTWFLKNKDKILEFPESKKQLTKLFPDKKEAIETFLKVNKISFDEESDRIKIIDFLAAL
jgi:hypothetical protein